MKERLDRVAASKDWLHLYCEAQLHHLDFQEFDHASILMRTTIKELGGTCPFWFLIVWANENSSQDVVGEASSNTLDDGLEAKKLLK